MQHILAIVTPRAHEDRVEDQTSLDPHQRVVRVWVTAVPDHNRANAAVIDLVAHHLGVAPSLVTIVRGHRGRKKLLKLLS
jgi:uncharacterized protein